MIKSMFFALLVAGSTSLAAGQDVDLYPVDALTEDRARYYERFPYLLERGLIDFMTEAERKAIAGLQVLHPLRGENALQAYSGWDRGVPTVVLPVLTLRMVEDLSLAYAWRHRNGYSLEPIDEYVAMLRYRNDSDFPGGRKPDPLTALGVPAGVAQTDTRVDDLSLRFRNTAWAFILAHEIGHLRFRHPGNKDTEPEISQANESEADAFAVDLLNRSGTIPMGAILWFQATIGYYQNRADFATEAEYWNWVQEAATHPVNPQRLQRLAIEMQRHAGSAGSNEADVMLFIAQNLAGMGEILAEPDMQRLIARCAVLGRPEDLKRTFDRPCDERLGQQ